MRLRFDGIVVTAVFLIATAASAKPQPPEIIILSTMVANFSGEGEWGFSALIRTPNEDLLFDTGFKDDTVLHNAERLGLDLSGVRTVILSHFHTDHTGGLLTLRRRFMDEHPDAFSRVLVGKGFFTQRYSQEGVPAYSLPMARDTKTFQHASAFRAAGEAIGIVFEEIAEPKMIAPGLVLSGPIERIHDERNVAPGFFLQNNGELTPDTVPESQVLGIQTEQGWILISGCGHAGIINATAKLRQIEAAPIAVGLGGFHLFRASDQTLSWTIEKLKGLGLKKFVGAHCTGAHATHEIGRALSLPRGDVSIGAVGTRIDSQLEIHRGSID